MKKLKDAKAQRIDGWRGELSAVYVYFNNDPERRSGEERVDAQTAIHRLHRLIYRICVICG